MISKFMPLAAVLALSGCASMLPYKDAFDCPQIERGQCVSVPTAHEYALNTPAGESTSGENDLAGLAVAMDAYRHAVAQGKTEEVAQALSEYKAAIKKGETDLIAEMENRVRTLIGEVENQSQQEALLKRAVTRQEFLAAYAQEGARTESVLMPPVVMEAFILPYQTSFGTLASERTLWITVEDAVWTWPEMFKDRKEEIGTTVRGR